MYLSSVADILVLFVASKIFGEGNGQLVTFEVVDSEYNEVIFVGERDIKVRCSVTMVTNVTGDFTIRIQNQDGSTLAESGVVSVLEYTVDSTREPPPGNLYTCVVGLTCADGSIATEEKTLSLNIKDPLEPRCFRNGTKGAPFQFGDILLLTCYCRVIDFCKWTSTIEGTGEAVNLDSESVDHGGKRIHRSVTQYVVGPATVRYDCLRITSMGVQRCSLGPVDMSSQDVVINENDVSTQSGFPGCTIPTTAMLLPTHSDQTTVLEQPTNEAFQRQDDYTVYLLIGSIGAFLSVLTVCCLTCVFCSSIRKHRGNKSNSGGTSEIHEYQNGGFSSSTEDEYSSPYYNSAKKLTVSSARVNNNSMDPVFNNAENALGHTYDDPPTARGSCDRLVVIEDGSADETQTEDYAEIGERRSYRRASVWDEKDSQPDGTTLRIVAPPHVGPVSTADNVHPDSSEADHERPSSGDNMDELSSGVGQHSDPGMLYAEVDKPKEGASDIVDSARNTDGVGSLYSDMDRSGQISGDEGRSMIDDDRAATQDAAVRVLYSVVDKFRKSNDSTDDSQEHESIHVGQSKSNEAGDDHDDRDGTTEDPVDFGMLYAKVDKTRGPRQNEPSEGEHEDDASELYASVCQ